MNEAPPHGRWREPVDDRVSESAPKHPAEGGRQGRPRSGARLLGLGALLALIGALAAGGWRHFEQQRDVLAVSEQRRNFVPSVRVATVKPSSEVAIARLPATTSVFAAANIFARASGYIEKRYADIGDQVKKGQLLVEITAPELDHRIAQAEATLAQLQAAQQQAQANLDLAQLTLNRNDPLVRKGWFTRQQGITDLQTLKAQHAAEGVAEANIAAQQGQLRVLRQQKAYQRVVSPFDGIITKRNVDVGSLVQADATSGTFLFSVVQSNTIRAKVFVPQDQAFGVAPGIDAILYVPEVPDRPFPGKVTRIANALAPGTRTLLTEVDIPNADGAVVAGSNCTIELRIPRKAPGLLVPAAAIILNGGTLEVAVVRDGIAHIQKISVARDLGTEIEVAGGVTRGDEIVLNPPIGIADGSRVSTRSSAVGELQ